MAYIHLTNIIQRYVITSLLFQNLNIWKFLKDYIYLVITTVTPHNKSVILWENIFICFIIIIIGEPLLHIKNDSRHGTYFPLPLTEF